MSSKKKSKEKVKDSKKNKKSKEKKSISSFVDSEDDNSNDKMDRSISDDGFEALNRLDQSEVSLKPAMETNNEIILKDIMNERVSLFLFRVSNDINIKKLDKMRLKFTSDGHIASKFEIEGDHYELIKGQSETYKYMIPLISDTKELLPSKPFSGQFNLIKKIDIDEVNKTEEKDQGISFIRNNVTVPKLPQLIVRYYPPGADSNWRKSANFKQKNDGEDDQNGSTHKKDKKKDKKRKNNISSSSVDSVDHLDNGKSPSDEQNSDKKKKKRKKK
eukprot:TRINITY_DN7617_c0_g1_i2.p1 TRINITY_DN7617_c0_g1~~TRINITY_DN7617_c0_g1_i2.p1  ORF type:complete len:274 (-),score=115.81 TRINITY_DN7617_c0_g1_i2:9-830(-)